MINIKKTMLVCISGGTGSGKTTVAHEIMHHIPKGIKATILYQDNYYKDQRNLPLKQRLLTNYDHPNAFDWNLMISDLKALMNKKTIKCPTYDYANHTRATQTITINPVDVIIFEGFMTMHNEEINHMANIKIFVDTPSDERLLRRLLRDIKERKRDPESIAKQWRTTVRPMHRTFVAPQKEIADVIVPWYNVNPIAVQAIESTIRNFVDKENAKK